MAKLKLTKPQRKRTFHLEVEQAVIVPSTKAKNKPVNDVVFKSRVKEVKKYLSNKFGGYTSVKGTGGYYSKGKGLIQEKVARVVSFSEKDNYKKNKQALIKKLGSWRKKWGQESMGYEHEGDLYYFGKGVEKSRKISPATRRKLLINLKKARKIKAMKLRKRK
jgi:hypothetical protein